MKVYIFERVNKCSRRYHEEGGVVVVAKDEEQLHKMISKEGDIKITAEEMNNVITYSLRGYPEPKVFVFPDAGCC
jgi:hypothetical protein